ncbi:MAG: glycosyltransferase [Pseudonocardiales bacterium]|nr:glycosyltransferase [Pseudonocardiales bacterium]
MSGFGGKNTHLGSVLLIAKQPLPGRVKTRLTPHFSYEQAAQLAAASLADTLLAASAIEADQHVLVLDGSPVDIDAPGWSVIAQCDGGLDARLAAAFEAVIDEGPAVLVGMDTPQLQPAQVAAFRPGDYDCCLGLAADGGFWAIGFADPRFAAKVIPGVAMSQADTGALQLERLLEAGLSVQLLDQLIDFDDAESARAVAARVPYSRFARTLASMGGAGS